MPRLRLSLGDDDDGCSTWAPQDALKKVSRNSATTHSEANVDFGSADVVVKPPLACRGSSQVGQAKSKVQAMFNKLRLEGKATQEPLRELDFHCSAPLGAVMNFNPTEGVPIPTSKRARRKSRSLAFGSTVYRVRYGNHALTPETLREQRQAQREAARSMRGDDRCFQWVVGAELAQFEEDAQPNSLSRVDYAADKLQRLRQLDAHAARLLQAPVWPPQTRKLPPMEDDGSHTARGPTPQHAPQPRPPRPGSAPPRRPSAPPAPPPAPEVDHEPVRASPAGTPPPPAEPYFSSALAPHYPPEEEVGAHPKARRHCPQRPAPTLPTQKELRPDVRGVRKPALPVTSRVDVSRFVASAQPLGGVTRQLAPWMSPGAVAAAHVQSPRHRTPAKQTAALTGVRIV
eukprot:Hpha_TRINITY_DN15709_c5_g3::TRINITY_DN15709_c5_g3_i1::g.37304::m.37304